MIFKKVFRKFDILGQRVYLTHESNQMYRTSLGAVFSIAFFIGMLSYFLAQASNVWNNKIKNINTITGFLDPNISSSVLSLHPDNFQFAFGFQEKLPREIGTLKL